MKKKEEYSYRERADLLRTYRKECKMATGTTSGVKWYLRGLAFAEKSEQYDQKNYEYYYDLQKHDLYYEKKGKMLFEKAAKCYRRSAELGNDLAMMNYAMYLLAFCDEKQEGLVWLNRASESGLAVADYVLAVCYQKGCGGVTPNAEKNVFYLTQYHKRCEESERQSVLAWDLPENGDMVGRGHLFAWFCGASAPALYDTPHALPSKWKYGI